MTAWEQIVVWDAVSAGFPSISEDNIQATAVVFNSEPVQRDSRPGYGWYFDAYFADAAAAAIPGTAGQNVTAPDFTHTVFIEGATATY